MGNWTPSIVPTVERTVYLVLDDFGNLGRVWRETDAEATDLEVIIRDMLRGEYSDPVRIVGFNVTEGWARDVSADVADEIRHRWRHGEEPSANLEGFMGRHEKHSDRAQLKLV